MDAKKLQAKWDAILRAEGLELESAPGMLSDRGQPQFRQDRDIARWEASRFPSGDDDHCAPQGHSNARKPTREPREPLYQYAQEHFYQASVLASNWPARLLTNDRLRQAHEILSLYAEGQVPREIKQSLNIRRTCRVPALTPLKNRIAAWQEVIALLGPRLAELEGWGGDAVEQLLALDPTLEPRVREILRIDGKRKPKTKKPEAPIHALPQSQGDSDHD